MFAPLEGSGSCSAALRQGIAVSVAHCAWAGGRIDRRPVGRGELALGRGPSFDSDLTISLCSAPG